MDDKEVIASLAKTSASLAQTLEATRAELDAIRTLMIGVIAALATNPAQTEVIARHVAAAVDADAAYALTTAMPDSMLQARAEWLPRLMPVELWRQVQQNRRT